jgi:hypothetical protein
MTTETTVDMTQDTTLAGPAGNQSTPSSQKRKRNARRNTVGEPRLATTLSESGNAGGFEVPIGDSGETFKSAWRFGG